jgi:hypothetical protein
MKRKFLLLLFLAIGFAGHTQKITGCGFKVPPLTIIKTNFKSIYEAQDIIKNMLDSVSGKKTLILGKKTAFKMLMPLSSIMPVGLFMTTPFWKM